VNAFDEWWRCHGYSTAKSIVDLSEEPDIRVFIEMFFKLLLKFGNRMAHSIHPLRKSYYIASFLLLSACSCTSCILI
jgi:hypothetical protein